MPPGAAGVRHEAVAFEPERLVGLEELGRLVAEVRERVRHAFEPVTGRARAPAADEDLGRAPRPALLVVAAERDQRRPTLAGGDHAIGDEACERAHDRVVDAVADHAAGTARGRSTGLTTVPAGACTRIGLM